MPSMIQLRLLALTAILLVVSGCGGSGSGSTTTAQTVTTPSVTLTVVRMNDDLLQAQAVRIPETRAVAAAALKILGVDAPVTIANGTATVDLGTADHDRTAEIVCTLTQFPTIRLVDVAGRTGLTCADFPSLLPAIFITSPAAGAHVAERFPVSGTASVFEATFQIQLLQRGKVVDTQTVTASEGAPGRGTFTTTLHGATGPATIRAFAPSAADGSPQHVVDVPVTLG